MSQASRESPPDTLADPLLEGFGALINTVFGADPLTRARTGAVLLSAVMYAICCGAAWMAAGIGTILPDAPAVLLAVCLPAHALFYVLIRSGRTRQCKDPALILPQNLLALLGVSFAYTAVGPNDRGLVLMLVCLIMVFGMYTHQTPKQSVQVGVTAMVLLGACMGVLSHWDPLYYPPHLELLRFELMAGTMPVLIYAAYQITSWRTQLTAQRRALRMALERVKVLATTDALTGLHNRHFMQDKLDQSVQRFNRYGESFTVALIDLDHFKRINDQHGHRVGDEVLAAFGKIAQDVLRDTDLIARWGGEEFLILMPATSETKAMAALQRLRQHLARPSLSPSAPALRVSFSGGVVRHDRADSLKQTLERADNALYRAKREGRDRCLTAS